MSRSLVAIGAIVALVGSVLLTSAEPAGATTGRYQSGDPCSLATQYGICISAISVDDTATTVTLTDTVGQATDPTTDANWDPANDGNNATVLIWTLFDGADTSADWTALAYDQDNSSGPPTFTGGVGGTNSQAPSCAGPGQVTTSFDLATNTYSLSFPASCIGDPASFSTKSGWLYDDAGTQLQAPIEPSNGNACCAVTPDTSSTTTAPPPTGPSSSTHGYWLVGSDGGIFSFGSAQFYGSMGATKLNRPIVGLVPTTDHGGYWLDASDGGVFSFGDTAFYGSLPGLGLGPAGSSGPGKHLNAPIVGMVPSFDDRGYFMVGADGGVFSFGDAHYEGSCPGIGGCAGAAVAVMPDASGNGYWLVTNTGRVYGFGDAANFGQPPAEFILVTSAMRTPDGKGYWLLYANGVVAPFGDASTFGSPAGQLGGADPASAIFATSDGGGYWVASANGGVEAYGDAPALGSMAGTRLNGPIVAAAGW